MTACFKTAKGFTLLEILVAFTILAIALSSIFQLFGGTLRNIEDSERYALAALLAEQTMNEKLFGESFEAGSDAGVYKGNESFKWSTEIGEYEEVIGWEMEPEQALQPVTYSVKVTVGWKDGKSERSLELISLKTFVEEAKR